MVYQIVFKINRLKTPKLVRDLAKQLIDVMPLYSKRKHVSSLRQITSRKENLKAQLQAQSIAQVIYI